MKTNRIASSLVASAVLAGLAIPAAADDFYCPPGIGNTTVDGNVLIVSGTCRLDGTTVKGNVLLYSGGALIARNVRIIGNIQAERADYVDIEGGYVEGSIQLDDMVGDLSRITRSEIGRNEVIGNIQLKGNRSRIEVIDNQVGGDVQAFSNSGGLLIADNDIDGNLQCKENSPPPRGGNNRVQGNKEDQCANLQPEDGQGGATPVTPPPSGGSNPIASSPSATSAGTSGGGGSMSPFALLGLLLAPLLRRRSGRPAAARSEA